MSFPDISTVRGRYFAAWAGLILGAGIYLFASTKLVTRPRFAEDPEFAVRLPVLAQMVMAMGDRHLAANLNGFHVLVAETARMKAEDYSIQAGLQRDIAWLNPAHEDNYYIAAAILPWGGQLEAAQYVLKRAGDARPFDWLPAFYYGFHYYHFYKNPAKGAEILLSVVSRVTDPQDQMALQNVAAFWIERGYQLEEAAGRVQAMANAAPAGGFRKYLAVRAARLRDLDRLRKLAREYERQSGRRLTELAALVQARLIDRLPVDPLGIGFDVDSGGEPVFRDALRSKAR